MERECVVVEVHSQLNVDVNAEDVKSFQKGEFELLE
jgi:hypothetical protein